MDEFKGLAVKRSVNKLFSGNCFSICDLDACAELLGVSVNQSIYVQLRVYHCVHFSEMTDTEKALIQDKVIECLRGDPILNPARVLHALTDEGRDFAFTEDRYLKLIN